MCEGEVLDRFKKVYRAQRHDFACRHIRHCDRACHRAQDATKCTVTLEGVIKCPIAPKVVTGGRSSCNTVVQAIMPLSDILIEHI